MHPATSACLCPRLHDKLIDEFLRSLAERNKAAAHFVYIARTDGGLKHFLYLLDHVRQLVEVVADATIHRIMATQVADEAAEEAIIEFGVTISHCPLEAVNRFQARPRSEGDELTGRPVFGKRVPEADHHVIKGLRFIFGLKTPALAAPQSVELFYWGYACSRAVDRAPEPHANDRRRKGAVIPLQHIFDVGIGCHDGYKVNTDISLVSRYLAPVRAAIQSERLSGTNRRRNVSRQPCALIWSFANTADFPEIFNRIAGRRLDDDFEAND